MDADERARLRALAGVVNAPLSTTEDREALCNACQPDVVLKLLDDVERLERNTNSVVGYFDILERRLDVERARAEAAERDARRYRAMKEYDAKRFHDDLDFDAQADALIADLASGKPVAPLAEGRQSILDERDALRQECERLRELLRHVQITLGVIKGGLGHYTEARGVLESCIGKIRAALAEPAPGGQENPHTENSAEWFAAEVEAVRRRVQAWPEWLRRTSDWAVATFPAAPGGQEMKP